MLPRHLNNTFIIVFIYSFLPGNALFEGFRVFIKCVLDCQLGKIRQNGAIYYYLLAINLVIKGNGLPLSSFITSTNFHTNHSYNNAQMILMFVLIFLVYFPYIYS